MFIFDLKSGYHHIEVAQESKKYLGFSFIFNHVTRYLEFSVLPFGLTTAPYIFTKVLKPLVTHWRSSGIFIALYLDDGLIVVPKPNTTHLYNRHTTTALEVSKHVKIDLFRAGLVYNDGKSNWEPNSSIQWLGMIWDNTRYIESPPKMRR